MKNLDSCFKNANLVAENLIDSSFASAEFCLSEKEKKIGSTCIDIGAGTAKIATYYEGNPEYINYVPLGGDDVTNDIERGLEIPKELAEYIKVLHGDLEHPSNKNIKLDLKNGNQKNITQNILACRILSHRSRAHLALHLATLQLLYRIWEKKVQSQQKSLHHKRKKRPQWLIL